MSPTKILMESSKWIRVTMLIKRRFLYLKWQAIIMIKSNIIPAPWRIFRNLAHFKSFGDRCEISNIVGICVPLEQFHLFLNEVRAVGVVQKHPRNFFALLTVDAKLIAGDWIRTEHLVLIPRQPMITFENQLWTEVRCQYQVRDWCVHTLVCVPEVPFPQFS